MGDALEVLERLPDASLRFVYLLHPDPWPKARHAKRRMVNPGPLDLIAAKLAAGRRVPARHRRSGLLPLGDDGDGPARATSNGWPRARATSSTRPGGWPETRYEAKARREGREVWYFRYRRC